MWHELLGFVLNALDEQERAAVEEFVHRNADARRAVERLQTHCLWLEAARDEPMPPAKLAVRTCLCVRSKMTAD